MAYKEKVQNKIKKDELKNLWEKICESYEQGGMEHVKSTLNERISTINKDYQEVLKKLEEML